MLSLQPGDRVAAMTFQPSDQNGTYRSVIDLSHSVEDGLDLDLAATVPLVGLTASQLLDRADLEDGNSLLVTGPPGAVGRLVVQLAAARGIHVIGAAVTDRTEEARTLGVRDVLPRDSDSRTIRQVVPAGVDAAIDLVGGTSAHLAFDAVHDGGTYVTSVPPYINSDRVFTSERDIDLDVLVVHPDRPQLTHLLDLVASGRLHTTIEARYPLQRAADAHARQAAGHLTGKLLLIP